MTYRKQSIFGEQGSAMRNAGRTPGLIAQRSGLVCPGRDLCGGNMDSIVFIGNAREAEAFRGAGIPSYAPPAGLLAERVLAERRRCGVLAMTARTFAALPAPLARELREGDWAKVSIVPDMVGDVDSSRIRELVNASLPSRSNADT